MTLTTTVTVVPAESPAAVRAREGFSTTATWYSPRRQRPHAFAQLHGRPADEADD